MIPNINSFTNVPIRNVTATYSKSFLNLNWTHLNRPIGVVVVYETRMGDSWESGETINRTQCNHFSLSVMPSFKECKLPIMVKAFFFEKCNGKCFPSNTFSLAKEVNLHEH